MSEKVLIAAVDTNVRDGWSAPDHLHELKELVTACQGEVVGTIICKIKEPTAAFFLGKGKVEEIALARATLGADMVVVGYDLKGNQQRNLEEAFGVKTIDRTQLILDIFARRAKSPEGKMQVELAQLQYRLPRLVGKGVELSRLGGGIGTMGPGETKLEVDRRRISQRIDRLRKDLEKVAQERKLKRKKRRDQHLTSVSLVGYTNAGKSTLLNCLTRAGQETQDALFTTLDPLSRQWVLPNGQKVVISDTVGFMHALPHHLIEAFKATLEEVQEADILLHVVDVSHPNFRNLHSVVQEVLAQLEASQKPTLTVLNKIDRLADPAVIPELENTFKDSVAISALRGDRLEQLEEKLMEFLSFENVNIDVNLPLNRMDLVNLIHSQGQVHKIQYASDSIHVVATIPASLASRFKLLTKSFWK